MNSFALYTEYAIIGSSLVGLVFAAYKAWYVRSEDPGDSDMQAIAARIQQGAMAFLKAEYTWLAGFVVIMAGVLWALNSTGGFEHDQTPLVSVSFVLGAIASGLAGFLGMRIATLANVRTTHAAHNGLAHALDVAFAGGAVMGFSVVGLALLGLGTLYMLYTAMGTTFFPGTTTSQQVSLTITALTGFSMGASSIALFARIGGGIYTKAADVGADLVGKVEAGLPEDDPRNPAVIADNVGDNVGDVAGMGADLFESYVAAIVGSMVLGFVLFEAAHGDARALGPVLFPLAVAGAGILASIVGTLSVHTTEKGNPQVALDTGGVVAAVTAAILTFVVAWWMWPEAGIVDPLRAPGSAFVIVWWRVALSSVIGLLAGLLVGFATSYYCSTGRAPVNSIVMQTKTGAATTLIAGLAVGMESTVIPVSVIALGVLMAHQVAGLYGVAMAALGTLSTLGIQLAIDAFGPVADNAGGIAEMSGQPPEIRKRTDKLDAVGNATAAMGKGFASASAAMAGLALFAAFCQVSGISRIDILNPRVTAGIMLGAVLPFALSSLTIKAVGIAAREMIEEVRRQFHEIPGLLDGHAEPDTERCVDISTQAALRRMVAPGLLALLSPIVLGFVLGPEALGGLLAGVTSTGICMAMFMSNAGGAWDNAKKSFEGDGFVMPDETVLRKGSDAYDAAVVGDTVGDPLKDTSGPSVNILIKLVSVVALVVAPMIAIERYKPLWDLLFY